LSSFYRLKNRIIAKFYTRFPQLAKKFIESFSPIETEGIPWSPVRKTLKESRVALITTAGVHQRDQKPFDMDDPDGDPTFRTIDVSRPIGDLMITHDYYDHADADRDINIVFPIQRIQELKSEGIIGDVATTHYGFMGHTLGRHIGTLLHQSASDVAQRLERDHVDVVLLTPG
jgi:D-proline reductase (dithiol) PrdB